MYKYVGSGFVAGIPARDLTDEEAEKIGIEKIMATGLYEAPKKLPKKDGK